MKTRPIPKFLARVLLTVGMTVLFVEVSMHFLGGGFSPVVLGVVLGYGLTDKLVELAA